MATAIKLIEPIQNEEETGELQRVGRQIEQGNVRAGIGVAELE